MELTVHKKTISYCMAAYERAKSLWLGYADSRPTEPQALITAALFIWQFDPPSKGGIYLEIVKRQNKRWRD